MVDMIDVERQLSFVDGVQQPLLPPLLSLRKDTINATLHHPFHFLTHSLEPIISNQALFYDTAYIIVMKIVLENKVLNGFH